MELKFVLESILFSAQQPLAPKELRDLLATAAEQDESGAARPFKKTPISNIEAALEELARDHEAAGRTYRLVCVAGVWQFASQPEFAPWLKALVGHRNRPTRLSAPALETLAIIAYRQPATRAEIEQVRGVAVDGVMQTLLERGLVEQVGRAEVVGRPITYGTTMVFLEYFGLRSLEDLPAADELRRIPVTKPEALLTVDPGLATVPPEQLISGDSDTSNGEATAVDPPPTDRATAERASTAGAGVVVMDAPSPLPRRRKDRQAKVEAPQEAVQVSSAESELPPTSGTASNSAGENVPPPHADSTGTGSAETPPTNRLERGKKTAEPEN